MCNLHISLSCCCRTTARVHDSHITSAAVELLHVLHVHMTHTLLFQSHSRSCRTEERAPCHQGHHRPGPRPTAGWHRRHGPVGKDGRCGQRVKGVGSGEGLRVLRTQRTRWDTPFGLQYKAAEKRDLACHTTRLAHRVSYIVSPYRPAHSYAHL